MKKKLKVKRLNDNINLKYQTPGSAGIDIICNETAHLTSNFPALIRTGISIEIPEGYQGEIRPRSGISLRERICVISGTIDSDYRGEVGVIAYYYGVGNKIINKGTRIAQLVITPCERMEIEYTDTLSNTERGRNGFGSTGK